MHAYVQASWKQQNFSRQSQKQSNHALTQPKTERKKSPNHTMIFLWVIRHVWNHRTHNSLSLIHDTVCGWVQKPSQLGIRWENVKNQRRVRHSCWLVGLWWGLMFRSKPSGGRGANLTFFGVLPKRNVFLYTVIIFLGPGACPLCPPFPPKKALNPLTVHVVNPLNW